MRLTKGMVSGGRVITYKSKLFHNDRLCAAAAEAAGTKVVIGHLAPYLEQLHF